MRLRAHTAVVTGGVAYLGLTVPLLLDAGVWAVAAMAAVAVMVAGHLCVTGELFAARVALEHRRQQDVARILAHRREELPTMFVASPGRHAS